jgi:hypothetical protein
MSEPKRPDPLPMSHEEIRRRIRDPKTRIVMASRDAIEDDELSPYVDRVMEAVSKVTGAGSGAWISDESCLSDFFDFFRDRAQDQLLYDQVGGELGIRLDRANDDDHFIARIALRLKRFESEPS